MKKLLISLILVSIILLIQSCGAESTLSISSGELVRLEDFSSKYVSPRHIDIWLPKNYTDTTSYSVLYMHDGQMLFDSTKTWNHQEWKVDEIMSSLISREIIQPTIVIGIHNGGDARHSEYFPQKPFESLDGEKQKELLAANRNKQTPLFSNGIQSDNYLKFLVEELKPYVDSAFSTNPNLSATSIAGSSMGGLISMYALCEYPDVFSKAACISTHWPGTFETENNPIPQAFTAYLNENLPDGRTHKIYFDYGTETLDAQYEPYQALVDSVMHKSSWPTANHKTMKFHGANHSENAWNQRLQFPLTFLLSDNKPLPNSPELTLEQANKLATLPLACMQTEYPNKLGQVLGGDSDLGSPKSLHPAFYGCFDWHSSVHGHWSAVKLLKEFPEISVGDSLRNMLEQNLTKANILKEVDYFQGKHNTSYERTYGWAWLLKLAEELHTWNDPLAKELEANLLPLTQLIEDRYIEFLPKLVYPIRVGEHTNTAFGLTFAWDYANSLNKTALKDSIEQRALDFYRRDKYGPLSYEPSGYDFLSPCLEEIDLMRRVMPERQFKLWLEEFLPELVLPNFRLSVGEIVDRTDGKLVHLDGLNFSRAWVLYGLAKAYPEYEHVKLIADEHMNYSLPNLVGDSYEGGHWLGSFAIYALSQK